MSRYDPSDPSQLHIDGHEHYFPEFVITEDDEDDNLKVGMHVLAPCPTCGETPRDAWSVDEMNLEEVHQAFTRLMLHQELYLFHWSPTKHRKQIMRRGLVPGRRPVTHPSAGFRAPVVCFGDTPRWAWALSGDQDSAPSGSWDLWQTRIDELVEPYVMPRSDYNGIHEIRTRHRVFKRGLWLVGTRIKD
jgi:hypothetical protein